MPNLTLELGAKTDPAEYRFSYEWLFRLLAEEGVRFVQLGTFFEIYQLPDEYFLHLRRQAEDLGVCIQSIFTAHRELGGFFVEEAGWEAVARQNYERLIKVGSLLGHRSVGSNPGAVYRDRLGLKRRGTERYLRHMKELMEYAHEKGVPWLTIEPMSCLAEPPTLPDELCEMAQSLDSFYRENPGRRARVGFCADIAHGYADQSGTVRFDHLQLLEAAMPHLYELHLKNTDARYSSTFGFAPADRERGIVRIEPIRQILSARAEVIPVNPLIGYLEIGGPKLGRDYSDPCLADQLRTSLAYLRETWVSAAPSPADESCEGTGDDRQRSGAQAAGDVAATGSVGASATVVSPAHAAAAPLPKPPRQVRVSPSVMCVDLMNLESGLRKLETAGADLFHIDMADGHFVPNLLLGLDVVRQVRPKTHLPLDVHLMVANPEPYLETLSQIGVEMVAVHAEASVHLDRTLAEIRRLGMKAGVALNPATSFAHIDYVLERLDYVLLMTVNPGFAGQKFAHGALRKISDCRRFLADHGASIPVMVNGNVSFQNIPRMVAAGADILVAGTSSWFCEKSSLAENVEKTEAAIAAGLKMRGEHGA